jgi:hypothetical protein
VEAVPELTTCQADAIISSADLQRTLRPSPLLNDPTLVDVICPVSQAESNVAFEDAVAVFAQQLGEFEASLAAQLFGNVSSVTGRMDDKAMHHSSPDSSKSSSISVSPVDEELITECRLEIDSTAPSDLDADTAPGSTDFSGANDR